MDQPFQLKLRKAYEVFPKERQQDQASLYDIVKTPMPSTYNRQINFEAEDHMPAAKWIGHILSPSDIMHQITVLAHQVKWLEPPTWRAIASFHSESDPVTAHVTIETPPMLPADFVNLLPKIHAQIFALEQTWKPRGF